MSGWWVALRLAWREVRRSRGRAALVVAMIAVPVLGLSYAAVSWDMFTLTEAEEADRQLGDADAIVSWPYQGPVVQDRSGQPRAGSEPPRRDRPYTTAQLLAVLPAGSRVLPDERSTVTLRTRAGGLAMVQARGLDLTDPITRGIGVVVDGRAPAGSREIAVTAEAADTHAVRIGDTVRSFDDTAAWRIVGLVRFPGAYGEIVAYRPGELPGLTPAEPGSRQWLVDTPAELTWPQIQRLNSAGILADARSLRLRPPAELATSAGEPADAGFTGSDAAATGSVALLAGLGVLEVILLAGPAFAVGARTRQRELALIAANGGTPAHLRRVVLADGVVLGAAGAVCGVALGIGLAWSGRGLSERYLFQAYAGGFRVFPAALLVICTAAVGTGMLAALVPAATAARQPVVAALTGRRGAVRSRRRWLVLGLAMVAVGGSVATVGAWQGSFGLILLGLTVGEVGLVLCTPSLLGLIGRLGPWLPLGARMSVRDTARNRSSAAPAISAVMAAVAGSVAVGVVLASDNARERAEYRPMLPPGTVAVRLEHPAGGPAARDLVAAAVATTRSTLRTDRTMVSDRATCAAGAGPDLSCSLEPVVPLARRCPYAPPQFDGEPSGAQRRAANADPRCADVATRFPLFPGAATTDGAALAALTGASGAELAAGSAVLTAGGVVTTDPRHVVDGRITLEARTVRGDGTLVHPVRSLTVPAYVLRSPVPALVVSPALVTGAGLATEPEAVLATPATAPDEATRQRLDAGLRAITPGVYSMVEEGPFGGDDTTLLLLAIAAGLITLGAAGVATGLAAVDGRNDLATLGAIGASPRVRRLLSLNQAGVIAGVGTALGLAAGLGAAYTILAAMNQGQLAPDRWPRDVPYPPTVPWSSLAVLLAVPVVAMLGAGLLTRSRLPIERRPG